MQESKLLSCPFCGEVPEYPSGDGTQYELECGCGMVSAGVQISDLMTIEERMDEKFTDYRYEEVYIHRARKEATEKWNQRAPITLDQAKQVLAEAGMIVLDKNDAISLFVHGERLYFDPQVDASVNFGSALDSLEESLITLRKQDKPDA